MNKIDKILNNNTITFARALLALSTLLTLLFTPFDDLFPIHHLNDIMDNNNGLLKLNFFLWFDNLFIPYLFSIFILFLVIIGFYPRIICLFHSWVAYSVFYSMLIVEGGDQINIILTFLLIPICLIDNRKNAWKPKTKNLKINKVFLINAKYSLVFISIQMAILYLNAGVAKIFEPEWSNGTAIYFWFYNNMFGAPNWVQNLIGGLFKNNFTVSIINWSVIFLEIFLFIGLFLNQKFKYILFILGFALHFFIVVIHGLTTFWLSMSGGLVLYFFRLDISLTQNLKNLKLTLINTIKL